MKIHYLLAFGLLLLEPLYAKDAVINFQETYLETPAQPTIYSIYLPAHNQQSNSPTILWLHGLGKHCRRYLDVMNFMAQHGFNSIGFDIRGHGRSGGIRGHIEHVSDCLQDLQRVYKQYQPTIKGKLFLVGHSMGGLLLVRHLQTQAHTILADACVLSAPCIAPHKKILSPFKQKLAKLIARIYPTFTVSLGEQKKRYLRAQKLRGAEQENDDPYVLQKVTAQGVARTIPAIDRIFPDINKITVPVHILASGKDTIVDTEATKRFYRQLPNNIDKSITVYDTMHHSILHEHDRMSAYTKLLSILQQYTSTPEPVVEHGFRHWFSEHTRSWYHRIKSWFGY